MSGAEIANRMFGKTAKAVSRTYKNVGSDVTERAMDTPSRVTGSRTAFRATAPGTGKRYNSKGKAVR